MGVSHLHFVRWGSKKIFSAICLAAVGCGCQFYGSSSVCIGFILCFVSNVFRALTKTWSQTQMQQIPGHAGARGHQNNPWRKHAGARAGRGKMYGLKNIIHLSIFGSKQLISSFSINLTSRVYHEQTGPKSWPKVRPCQVWSWSEKNCRRQQK